MWDLETCPDGKMVEAHCATGEPNLWVRNTISRRESHTNLKDQNRKMDEILRVCAY